MSLLERLYAASLARQKKRADRSREAVRTGAFRIEAHGRANLREQQRNWRPGTGVPYPRA
jgi:hypothetical protein